MSGHAQGQDTAAQCGLRTSNISIAWELVRKAESQMLPLPLPLPHSLPPSLIKSDSAFYQDSQVIRMHINILEALLC